MIRVFVAKRLISLCGWKNQLFHLLNKALYYQLRDMFNDLTEKLYGNMIINEYAKTYSVNIRNRFKSAATHVLIANYTTNYSR